MTLEDLPADMGAYTSFAIEDYVTQVGQGTIKDRPREHLAGTDARLVLLRRLWLREINALVEGQPLTDWTDSRRAAGAAGGEARRPRQVCNDYASRRVFSRVCIAIIGIASPARADPVADFYTGKTISLLLSVGEGDGMDKAARVIARHWSRHIPGNPAIIVRNMPGAGGLRVTNFLYNQAPKDGTTVAGIIPAFVRQQMLGGQGVDYDSAKFNWLGSSNTSNTTVFVWHTTGVTTLTQAMERELLLGATGVGSNSAHYPTILNNVLGTKFKIVMGYRATPAINLAVEQGEVHGRAGETFNTLMLNTPDVGAGEEDQPAGPDRPAAGAEFRARADAHGFCTRSNRAAPCCGCSPTRSRSGGPISRRPACRPSGSPRCAPRSRRPCAIRRCSPMPSRSASTSRSRAARRCRSSPRA